MKKRVFMEKEIIQGSTPGCHILEVDLARRRNIMDRIVIDRTSEECVKATSVEKD